jgi:hypothetical protein
MLDESVPVKLKLELSVSPGQQHGPFESQDGPFFLF